MMLSIPAVVGCFAVRFDDEEVFAVEADVFSDVARCSALNLLPMERIEDASRVHDLNGQMSGVLPAFIFPGAYRLATEKDGWSSSVLFLSPLFFLPLPLGLALVWPFCCLCGGGRLSPCFPRLLPSQTAP